jgi:DNA-binding response OmpR family regulator
VKKNEQHILIIEDDADITDALQLILTTEGYQVTAITEATDIISTVMEVNPDLVITDYILERINGGEYCSALKHDERTANIPVIILSGHGRVLDSLGDYGADRIMEKPFNNDELLGVIAQLLEGKAVHC